MKKCPYCGFENQEPTPRCPECGGYYSKIIELIDQAAAEEEKNSGAARYRRIIQSGNIKQAIISEIRQIVDGLSGQAKLTLWVVFVFVFALVFAF